MPESENASRVGRTTPHRAHARPLETDIATSISILVEVLGRGLVAVILNEEVDAVTRSIANPDLSDEQQDRVIHALRVVRLLLTRDKPSVVRSWFMGMNPLLDDQSPAEVLSSGRSLEVEAAATSFAV